MKLKHLTEERCSICNAATRRIEAISQPEAPENKDEIRIYTCGRKLCYFTYNEKVSEISICRNSEQYRNYVCRMQKGLDKLIEFTQTLDLSNNEKEYLTNYFERNKRLISI